jgi:hypothetical protein
MRALAGFNGINLLYGGSLKVLFNEQSTSFLTIAGVTFTSTGSRAPPRQSSHSFPPCAVAAGCRRDQPEWRPALDPRLTQWRLRRIPASPARNRYASEPGRSDQRMASDGGAVTPVCRRA